MLKSIKTVPIRILFNPLVLRNFTTLSKYLTHNQVLRKLVKLHNSQNVNIFDITGFKGTFSYRESAFFLCIQDDYQ
ncbi:hypothetical protein BCR24_04040 [Enterococcus ureilyticus]|uniref:Uncharacterized protein n=1 Tax=Enterococcus ureilyticus TaxID=1131292 RepID=A0A1E5HCB7_9ENTE|nr:hypothetical protein BCR24_04040 [Enterococcus ureilyticus]